MPRGSDGAAHPLIVKTIETLPTEHPSVDIKQNESMKVIESMVHTATEKYGTHNLVEEFMSCYCWRIRAG